ncbi:hypothetical protein SAMN04488059_1561 [Devosia psychrophila]|uniref:Uncharacterized protein n=1 Tax=Devosia psychrophila TaxID=728005 RepID=A0A1I1S654_9HYPH|nr:hypothetical protein SAMN04488059_1561 [Devosia psychrophila]
MAEMVKGFGCLLAYESLSCRNPWSAGVALWVLLFWGDRVRASNRGAWRGGSVDEPASWPGPGLGNYGRDEIGVQNDRDCGAARSRA